MGANVSSVTARCSAQRQLIGALIETRIDYVYALSFNLVFRDPVRSISQQSTCRTTIDRVANGCTASYGQSRSGLFDNRALCLWASCERRHPVRCCSDCASCIGGPVVPGYAEAQSSNSSCG